MKFQKTTDYLKAATKVFEGKIKLIWAYTDDYSKEDILQLRDELKAEGLSTEKLRRYRRKDDSNS